MNRVDAATLWPDTGWSPALQEWQHLEWARQQGMPVPEAVAAGEYIGPWGRLQSFLAVEELIGMLPLHEAVPLAAERLDPASFRRWNWFSGYRCRTFPDASITSQSFPKRGC